MKTIKALLIDPKDRTVTEIELVKTEDMGVLAALYTAIGCEFVECPVELANGDGVVMDEEGLFKSDLNFFSVDTFPSPLVGKAVIVGTSPDGDWVSCKTTLAEALKQVHFLGPTEAKEMYTFLKLQWAATALRAKELGIEFIDANIYPEIEDDK
jgi:hypothetical protein